MTYRKEITNLKSFISMFLKNKRIVASSSRGLEQNIDRSVSLSLNLSICQKTDFSAKFCGRKYYLN